MNKKLQVFVSSTYTDLIEERQAAVEAILDAGHIPAGMELFKAGNESQLQTIYKWIDESDVYMLILGGRYGSIESKSGKSYTQLEYEYAISKNIPIFSVVLSESFLTEKINILKLSDVMEQKVPDKYQTFKLLVMSKIVRMVDDCKDIKISIHSTLNEFTNTYNLIGWIRNDNDSIKLLKENSNLLRENNNLNKQLQTINEKLKTKSVKHIGNFSYPALIKTFTNKKFKIPPNVIELFNNTCEIEINALDFYRLYFHKFVIGIESKGNSSSEEQQFVYQNIAPYYVGFNFLERVKVSDTWVYRIQTTKHGSSFYAMVEVKNSLDE